MFLTAFPRFSFLFPNFHSGSFIEFVLYILYFSKAFKTTKIPIQNTITFTRALCTPNVSRIKPDIPTVKPTNNPFNIAK